MKSPKKSETLEVRLPHEMKQSFMQRCRATGASASDVVRAAIESYLSGPESSSKAGAFLMPSPRFALISSALLIAGAAVAGLLAVQPSNAHPDLQGQFSSLDADHDGQVTATEYAAGQSPNRVFIIQRDGAPSAAHGTGGTFTLPLTGHVAAPPPGARAPTGEELSRLNARQFALTDGDGDGRITLDEYTARHRAMANQGFVALDANGDGRITQREFANMFGPDAPPPPMLGEQFTGLDANHDGAVTPDEFTAGH